MSGKARVIDFRVRPPVAGFEKATMYAAPERTARMGAGFGFSVPTPALQQPTAAVFEAELDAAEIELAVITGRVGAPKVGPASNDALVTYARSSPERLCVFISVDPAQAGWRADAERLLRENVVRGLV